MRPGSRLDLARIVPSGQSVALGVALLVCGAAAWAGARFTSVFAVERVAITGAPTEVATGARRVLAAAERQSLLALDLHRLRASIEALPTVESATLDRAFPHTLVVAVVPERPTAVLRQGAASWLVSRRGRVMRTLGRGERRGLPRVWVGRDVQVRVGELLRGHAASAVAAVAPLAASAPTLRVASAHAAADELTLKLRGGLEVRLGDGADLTLKLAVAARIAPTLDLGIRYLDVAIPRWPVAGESLNSQVEVQTEGSSTP